MNKIEQYVEDNRVKKICYPTEYKTLKACLMASADGVAQFENGVYSRGALLFKYFTLDG